ncbi:WXG100 family type VII secretion target [Streptomyces sp. NPDC054940]
MGDGFRGETQGMIDAMDAMIAASNKVRASLDTLEGAIQPTLNEWEGASKQAYVDAQLVWDGAAKRLQAFLTTAAQAVGSVAEIYQQQDLQVQRTFQG